MKLTKSQRFCKARLLATKYFKLACEWDGFKTSEMFVVFSPQNPYVAKANLAAILLQNELRGNCKNETC